MRNYESGMRTKYGNPVKEDDLNVFKNIADRCACEKARDEYNEFEVAELIRHLEDISKSDGVDLRQEHTYMIQLMRAVGNLMIDNDANRNLFLINHGVNVSVN